MSKKLEYIVTESGCHEVVNRFIDKWGYPIIRLGSKMVAAHRYVYIKKILKVDDLDSSIVVRHKCDNPKCINPEHLELGSHKDNYNDMIDRGRQTKGETSGMAKLTEKDIRIMRTSFHLGFKNIKELSNIFGVSYNHARRIVNYETWTHI